MPCHENTNDIVNNNKIKIVQKILSTIIKYICTRILRLSWAVCSMYVDGEQFSQFIIFNIFYNL